MLSLSLEIRQGYIHLPIHSSLELLAVVTSLVQ